MIKSEHCVRLHHTLKTPNCVYMMQDYCNGTDLSQLLKLRETLSQREVSNILRQLVLGGQHLWSLDIIHRDIKLANILLHFPFNPEVDSMSIEEKLYFLQNFDFVNGQFKAVISDFGLSAIVKPGEQALLNICGTPLYSSP